MAVIGAYEAKSHFAALLERVQAGEEITITKHGSPVARMVPVEKAIEREAQEVVAEMRAIRKRCRLNGISIREMAEEGRRY